MAKSANPYKWTDKLDLATQNGLDEFEVLCALAHNPSYVWQAATGVAARTGVTYLSVVATLIRLESRGLVTPHPIRLDLYGETSSVRPWLSAARRPSRVLAA